MIRTLLSKLLPYRSFRRFLALHVGGIVVLLYVASSCQSIHIQGNELPLGRWFSFPEMWRLASALARWLYYIPAAFVVQIVCAEFELKLVRAQIIAGLERRDIIVGWLLQNALLTVFATVTAFAMAALVGINAGSGWEPGVALTSAVGFVLYGIAFLNFAVLAAVLLRRPVPALTALTLWPLVVEPAAGAILERYGLTAWHMYLPFTSLGYLAPFPGLSEPFVLLAPVTAAALGFAVLAPVLAWLRLERLDL